ncbi:MAG: glycogen debranching protein GlgX [Acidimicrobiaceae bacterium]|nr:glycogen debranching protein GlgX [Acidimicrobiaceae bacterium]MYD07595.1 glycogen debranching protein GlgX [Acidimicrobiaceae bacterium]MYI59640.1 glycogen debranching protein GlgX [Acidimicrobiaceae bacterium]
MSVWPGRLYPLGATFDGQGTNFAAYSEMADRVEVCLLSPDGQERRLDLPEVTAFVHHGYIGGIEPGQRYGFRVHGPWDPNQGAWCNPAKLLIDPYAKAITGDLSWGAEVYGFQQDDHGSPDPVDSAPYMPTAVVVDPSFDWEDDSPPDTPLHRTVIYETHVRGISIAHPDVSEDLRGTYAGMVSDPVLEHLLSLGVTAVELLPVHHFVSEHVLAKQGLSNYWGYNTLGFFAPHGPYCSSGDTGEQVVEFKAMVKKMHQAGIEVILDVVYNHSAEGNHLGPLLSFKGLDNRCYYHLDPANPRLYLDFTGTGNTLNMGNAQSLQMMMDSLRYWVQDMHVDGFRFDLAPALARSLYQVDRLSSFFDLIHQDPVINQVKLIAEPWDVGPGGYQVGGFPPKWSEWNAKYRDDVREYWRSEHESLPDLATRLAGSSDLYAASGRRPSASINFITAHDGFTLADLVAYDHKHNEANGEDNRDGESHNRSWNSGVEGPSAEQSILQIRNARRRSMLATLLLSQGVPMLLGGDELGRTQGGNNNAYAQDNEVSWYDWDSVDAEFLFFTRKLISLRAAHPVFRRRRWFRGEPVSGTEIDDMIWFTPDGTEMTHDDWRTGHARSVAVFLNGEAITAVGSRGQRIVDDSFLMLFNASSEPSNFTLSSRLGSWEWDVEFDTADDTRRGSFQTASKISVGAWALMLLRREGPT